METLGWFGYIGDSLIEGQSPFAEFSLPTQHIVGKPPALSKAPKLIHIFAATPKGERIRYASAKFLVNISNRIDREKRKNCLQH